MLRFIFKIVEIKESIIIILSQIKAHHVFDELNFKINDNTWKIEKRIIEKNIQYYIYSTISIPLKNSLKLNDTPTSTPTTAYTEAPISSVKSPLL